MRAPDPPYRPPSFVHGPLVPSLLPAILLPRHPAVVVVGRDRQLRLVPRSLTHIPPAASCVGPGHGARRPCEPRFMLELRPTSSGNAVEEALRRRAPRGGTWPQEATRPYQETRGTIASIRAILCAYRPDSFSPPWTLFSTPRLPSIHDASHVGGEWGMMGRDGRVSVGRQWVRDLHFQRRTTTAARRHAQEGAG